MVNEKLEQIKSLCDVMKDTECVIDWNDKIANIDFVGNNNRFKLRVFAHVAKEDLEDYLEDAKNMIKFYESVCVKLEALLLLEAIKNPKGEDNNVK